MITKEYLQQELAKRIDGYKRGVETTTDNIIAEMKSILVLVDALPDYEKKYNEALERARALWREAIKKGYVDDYLKDYETIFPELRESEDERIRKALIDALKVSETIGELKFRLPYPTREECIAYLEKQKYDRMQPIYDNQESFESALDKAWKSYNDSGARTVDGCEDNYTECAYAKGFREGYLFGLEKQKNLDKMIVVSPEVWDKAISDAYENGKKDGEKQKEQKPVDFPTTDEEVNEFLETHPKVEVPEKYKTPDFVFKRCELNTALTD